MSLKDFKKTALIIILSVFGALVLTFSAFASSYIVSYGNDIVAGDSTTIRSSEVQKYSWLQLQLTTPADRELQFLSQAEKDGVAYFDLSEYYFREAGVYELRTKFAKTDYYGPASTFEVFPGSPSLQKSKIYPDYQVAQIEDEPVLLTVTLNDKYRNPVEGHVIQLSSSNPNDQISFIDSNITDSDGEVSFYVKSSKIGNVTYEAYDKTADLKLDGVAKVLYFSDSKYIFANDYFSSSIAAYGAPSGPIDHFEFEDIPSQVTTGTPLTITVAAYDAVDETVLEYDGTVRFSVTGDNSEYAILPEDYTFTPGDLGIHTFSLAFTFQQPGTYNLEVRDIDNSSIYTTQSINVVDSGNSSSTVPTTGINLTNPVNGTYSNNLQVISGQTDPGSQVKIFDNDIEISTVVADVSGNFSYTTPPLTDGTHIFYAAKVTDIGTIIEMSDQISITIDTSAPVIDEIFVDPSTSVSPGTVVKISFAMTDPLSSATIIFNDGIYDMVELSPGVFEGTLATPTTAGVFPVSFVLIDELGNESKLDNEFEITVSGDSVTPPLTTDDSEIVVGKVTGVYAVPDNNKITLSWFPPSLSTYPIAGYRIFYGLSPNQLTTAVDTFDETTTWYIPNLENEKTYFFSVAAIDSSGNISSELSDIITGMPEFVVSDTPSPDVNMGYGGGDAISDMESDVSDSGPGLKVVILLSALFGIIYSENARRRLKLVNEDIKECSNDIRDSIKSIF